MTILRFDDFNRNDNPTDIGPPSDGGAAWNVPSPADASYGILAHQLYCSVVSGNPGIAWLDCGKSNHRVKETIAVYGSITGNTRILARISDASNYIFVSFKKANQNLIFGKVVANVEADMAPISTALTDGDVIELQASGDTIILYKNGLFISNFVESFNNTATGGGVLLDDLGAARIDDFSISDTLIPATNLPGQIWL